MTSGLDTHEHTHKHAHIQSIIREEIDVFYFNGKKKLKFNPFKITLWPSMVTYTYNPNT